MKVSILLSRAILTLYLHSCKFTSFHSDSPSVKVKVKVGSEVKHSKAATGQEPTFQVKTNSMQ